MDERSDQDLVRATRAGDKRAYGALVETHYHQVFLLCLGMLGRIHDAEDVAQDVMLRGFTEIRKLRDGKRFGPWVRRMAKNMCINFIRRTSIGRRAIEERAQQPSASRDDSSRLHRAIGKLPKEVRLPLIMYYLDGQDVTTVAQNLNMSRANVYARLRTATRQLHELLAGEGERQ